MNINYLRYFLAVCEYGSITKAAENIHISQPSITAAIQYLEQNYRIKLFNRKNKKLQLTEEGFKFLQYTKALLHQCDDFTRKTMDIETGRKITLKVGMPGVLGSFFLDKIVPDFEQEHPDINLEIFEIPTVDGIKRIQDSTLDFVIGITNFIPQSNCNVAKIFTTELMLAVSKNNPLSDSSEIMPSQIKDCRFVTISEGSFHYKILRKMFPEQDLNIVLHSNQVSTIKYMIENDYAVAIIYKDIFKDDKNIRTIPFKDSISADINMFWRGDSYCNSASKTFISYLRNIAGVPVK